MTINGLFVDKSAYVRALVKAMPRHPVHPNVLTTTLLMYHAEVPYDQAERYLRAIAGKELVRRPMGLVEVVPEKTVRELFRAAGMPGPAVEEHLKTLARKRPHLASG